MLGDRSAIKRSLAFLSNKRTVISPVCGIPLVIVSNAWWNVYGVDEA